MEKMRFWSRVGGWIRTATRHGNHGNGNGDSLAVLGGESSESVAPDGEAGFATSKVRRMPKSGGLDRLDDAYARVLSLVQSIQTHCETQDERSQRITASLEKLVQAAERNTESSRCQVELLTGVYERLEGDSHRLRRIDEQLCQLPQLADAQREALTAISRQLDGTRQTGERVAVALNGFEQGLRSLAEATASSENAMRTLHAELAAREHRISEALQGQSRRLMLLTCVCVGAALVGATFGVAALLR